MKIPTMLLRRILLDVRLQPLDTTNADVREIERRFEHEGMSFLTITLPTLDKALITGLERGHLTPNDFVGFRPYRRGGSLPALLSGFFRRVFDTDGWLLDDPCVDSIRAIRQVACLFKKVELPCSDDRQKAAYERYISNDQEHVNWSRTGDHDLRLLDAVSGFLWSELEMRSLDFAAHTAFFGSGATAERLKRNERWDVTKWPLRSETHFPAVRHALARVDSPGIENIRFLSAEEEEPVRVVQVPKTLKTPRTISIEPSYMMLMQQSIARPLMLYLERDWKYKGLVRFTDQTHNNRLAYLGSVDRSFATIDLSDASDLVDYDLVRRIFKSCPTFFDYIDACRSTHARVPKGDGTKVRIKLRKFASMGSALCFPVEAMVFSTIVVYSICKQLRMRPSRKLVQSIARACSVYGDDIIVPNQVGPGVMADLEAFGLKVNRDKSFTKGFFRESCGGDYYKGENITPTYVRKWDFTGRYDAAGLASTVSLSNQLYMKGLWNAADFIRQALDRRGYNIPYSRYPIGCLHYISVLKCTGLSWDKRLHNYRVKGYVPKAAREDDSPRTMDGFLLLAFGRGKLHNQEDSGTRPEPAFAGWDACSPPLDSEFIRLAREQGISTLARRTEAWMQRNSGIVNRGYRYLNTEWSRAGNFSTQEIPSMGPTGLFPYNRKVDRNRPWTEAGLQSEIGAQRHLFVKQPASLTSSERPYALCLKRKWTASPAGLSY